MYDFVYIYICIRYFPAITTLCLFCLYMHMQYIGALYVNTISGYNIPSRRRVYFEASNPNQPIMRVPRSIDEEQEVIDSFSWDRSELTYIPI